MQHQQLGNFPQAEAILRQVLQAAPHQPDALHLMGTLALQDGDIEAAIRWIGKAIRFVPNNPEYLNNLGFAYHEQGKLDMAKEHYRKAITLQPNYANAHYNLHALQIDPSDMVPSVRSLERVLALNPLDQEAHYMLGVLLDCSGNAQAAVEHFERLETGSDVDRARLDAWHYLKSAAPKLPAITGSMLDTFKHAFRAAPASGLVLEFGVRHGNTIRQIAALAGQEVHGFDSFEGLPEAWHHESKGSYSTKGVLPAVPRNVKLHAGWFEKTLPEFLSKTPGPVRLLNIDCDIYSSTKTVLDCLARRIVPGTVIVFDEYIGNAHWREDEFKAFQEAVAKYGWSYEYLCFSVFTKQVVAVIL